MCNTPLSLRADRAVRDFAMDRELQIHPLEAARCGDDPYWMPARVSLWTTAFVVLGGLLTLLVFIGEAVRDAFDPRKAPRIGRPR